MQWLIFLLAAAAGGANPAQAGANSQLKKSLDLPVWSTVWVYLSGLLGLLVIQLFARELLPNAEKLERVPWWAWAGGLLSIASTISGVLFAQKLGSGVFTGITLTASLATSVLLDHFGLMGFQPHPASTMRLVGCGLLITGIWFVAKF